MSISMIQEIKETLVNHLLKWRKQIANGLVVIALVLLLTVINKATPNNSAWLQGNWTNQSINYSFKARNKGFSTWTIRCKGALVIKQARVTVNSNKKRLIMTDDGNTVEYCMTRMGRKQLKLEVMRNGKSENTFKLKKE